MVKGVCQWHKHKSPVAIKLVSHYTAFQPAVYASDTTTPFVIWTSSIIKRYQSILSMVVTYLIEITRSNDPFSTKLGHRQLKDLILSPHRRHYLISAQPTWQTFWNCSCICPESMWTKLTMKAIVHFTLQHKQVNFYWIPMFDCSFASYLIMSSFNLLAKEAFINDVVIFVWIFFGGSSQFFCWQHCSLMATNCPLKRSNFFHKLKFQIVIK